MLLPGHHECEIRAGRELESAESAYLWDKCKKNRGHERFIPVQDFTEKHLPYYLEDDKEFEKLRTFVDLTVRLRVHWTSRDRPRDDNFAGYRGTDRLRLGSGFIFEINVTDPESGKPCPCDECHGEVVRRFWTFSVHTARHVVYNTEEAKQTKVDLFYDDDTCDLDGRMETVWALEVNRSYDNMDFCDMACVTHSETLAKKITPLKYFRLMVKKEIVNPPKNREGHAVVVSHPHGQSKKITVGRCIRRGDISKGQLYFEYHTDTCPGSSGAPVLPINDPHFGAEFFRWRPLVHSGTFNKSYKESKDHVNYSNSLPLLS